METLSPQSRSETLPLSDSISDSSIYNCNRRVLDNVSRGEETELWGLTKKMG